ncbi:MAG: zinc dependent phospholipase C family protein [Verrucomicrobia bacterium]|nr:zinc dependent phospholipase C family protein [Verrucomicrobiota bacterium]
MKRIALLLCVTVSLAVDGRACAPNGHVFVALAAIEKLKQSDEPAARKLAAVLEKHRWVVCHASEAPDEVQNERKYENSHYLVLFRVSYESPQAFDLKVAQPVFTSLLRDCYRLNYGLTPEDRAKFKPALYTEPAPQKREIGLAFAAGYISHLLADYFCHRPALTWWEKDSIMQEATKRARPGESYGPIQSLFGAFLWQSHAKEYGVTDELRERFVREVDDAKQDNGALPFCALACSRKFYAGWGIDAGKFAAPDKYEACARPMTGRDHLGGCIQHYRKETQEIFDATGRSFEENLRIGTELTGWRKVYDDVIAMIAKTWANAAPAIVIEP